MLGLSRIPRGLRVKKRLIVILFLVLLVGVGTLVYVGRQRARVAELYYAGTVEVRQAELAEGKAALKEARGRLKQIDATRRELQAARARLESAETARDLADTILSYARLQAPFNGILTRRSVEPGEVVTAGQEVFSLADLTTVDLKIYVNETEIGNVKPGMQAEVRTDTFPDKVYRGHTTMGVVIPPGWSAAIQAERESPLQVLFDGSDPNYAGISRGYVTAFIERYNQDRLGAALSRRGLERVRPPLEGRIRVWFNEELESRNFVVPDIIAIIIMIVGAILTSLVVAREYENGTMETIRSLPVERTEFMVGKAAPYFLIALALLGIAVFAGAVTRFKKRLD